MKKLFILFIVLAGFGVSSYGQLNVDGTATATIVSAIKIANARNLNFGTILPSSGAGTSTVTIGNTNTSKAVGANGTFVTGTSSETAHFIVTAQGDSKYKITLETPINLTGTTTTMSAALTMSGLATGNESSVADIYVGGILTVADGQTAGVNSGTFNIAVAYE